nr:isochorismate synthase [uncultured Carboxylicivirga sp.]
MNTTHIPEKISDLIRLGANSVILYRLPHQNNKILQIGMASYAKEVKEEWLNNGFIIHPFNAENFRSIYVSRELNYEFEGVLSEDIAYKVISLYQQYLKYDEDVEITFEEYHQQFNMMYNALMNGELDKVILSRIKKVPSFAVENVIHFFNELCGLYEHAFVYTLVTPETGVWIGAGPELLLGKSHESLQTVSLAGTLPNKPNTLWSLKEEDEQALVTDYMKTVLDNNNIQDYQINGPYTMKAGQVKHLRTDFKFNSSQLGSGLMRLLTQLHPTPAVCGMPKERAIDHISEIESNRREYYAGFLGPVNNGNFSFYVNIRCLKLTHSHASLYLGGGLTRGSEVNKEWEETELKAQTLLSVLKNIANLQGYE